MAVTRSGIPFLALLIWSGPVSGSRLPVRSYTTADGLARDFVTCAVQDRQGFLWFCTAEGLSRFDGYQFTTYGVKQGLPSNIIFDFLSTRGGDYWVAAQGGLCRFDPRGADSLFRCFPTSGTNAVPDPAVLYEDRNGTVWCGADNNGGLYRFVPQSGGFERVDSGMPDASVTALRMDHRGSLWIGSPSGLYRMDPGGFTRVPDSRRLPNTFIMAVIETRDGSLWLGTRDGLAQMRPDGKLDIYSTAQGLPGHRVEDLLEDSDGTLWVSTNNGLARKTSVGQGKTFESYALEQGLSAKSVGPLMEDRDGNLWIGTYGSGVMKVARTGFTSFTEADGVGNSFEQHSFEDSRRWVKARAKVRLDRAGTPILIRVGSSPRTDLSRDQSFTATGASIAPFS